jgi:hypothetical protein
LFAAVGCDQFEPHRPVTPASYSRPGDFMLGIDRIDIPDTITLGDSLHMPFHIADGQSACSYFNHTDVWWAMRLMVAPWGVNHPGPACRMTEFVIDTKPGLMTPLSPEDTVEAPSNYHVVICRPAGGFIAHDVYIRTTWRVKPARKIDADSLARYDATECRTWEERALRN